MKITKRQLRSIIQEALELNEKKKKGLWANVHAKRKRGEKPAKKGDKDYPDEKSWKSAQEADYVEGDALEEIDELEEAEYQGRKVSVDKVLEEEKKKTDKDRMKCNSPRYLRDGETGHGKKQKVVKACDPDTDKEKIVKFGDAKMRNNSDKPKNKANFRSRHNCSDKSMKKDWDAAGYWACKDW